MPDDTSDMHSKVEEAPYCPLAAGLTEQQRMQAMARCTDLALVAYLRGVMGPDTVLLVMGDHASPDVGTKQASLEWNAQQSARQKLGGGTAPRRQRSDGSYTGDLSRIFALLLAPGRVLPGINVRLGTMLDMGTTLLDAAGLDPLGPGLGRSLLQPGVPTLPEWAREVGVDYDSELEAWAMNEAVRTCVWGGPPVSAKGCWFDDGVLEAERVSPEGRQCGGPGAARR